MKIFALGFFGTSESGIQASNNLQDVLSINKPLNLSFVYSEAIPSNESSGYYGTSQDHNVTKSPAIILLGEYQAQTDSQDAKYREVGRLLGLQTSEDIRREILKFAEAPSPEPAQEGESEIETGSGIGIVGKKCPKLVPRFLCRKFGFGKPLSIIIMLLLILFIYKMVK